VATSHKADTANGWVFERLSRCRCGRSNDLTPTLHFPPVVPHAKLISRQCWNDESQGNLVNVRVSNHWLFSCCHLHLLSSLYSNVKARTRTFCGNLSSQSDAIQDGRPWNISKPGGCVKTQRRALQGSAPLQRGWRAGGWLARRYHFPGHNL
jgi:hypothetical protein